MQNQPRGWLTEHVVQRLRHAIMDGELPMGAALSESKLAAALGISRSPVRDALAALARQGLIVVEPQRASFVFLPTQQDIRSLCEFRCMLEVQAMRLAVERQYAQTLAQLHAVAQDVTRAIRARDNLRRARADSAFHAVAIANSGNPYLHHAWQLVAGKVGALRANLAQPAMQAQSNAEHLDIVAKLKARDIDGALDALQTHILKMSDRYSVETAAPHDGAHRNRYKRLSCTQADLELILTPMDAPA